MERYLRHGSVTSRPTQVKAPYINPSQAGRNSICPLRIDGKVRIFWSWLGHLHNEMVYLTDDITILHFWDLKPERFVYHTAVVAILILKIMTKYW